MFDFEIIVKSSHLNVGPDLLSRIETDEEPTNIEDGFTMRIFLELTWKMTIMLQ